MTTVARPICLWCKHLNDSDDAFTCTAFPNGIPEEIVQSRHDHRFPYPGEASYRGGTVHFEPKPGADTETLGQRFRLLFGEE